jgi:hypothetical protein
MRQDGLKKFVDDLRGDAPRTVSAAKLDENFLRCMPAERGLLAQMKINHTQEGWYLDFGPPNSTIRLKKFDVCENGQPKQYNMVVWD